MYPLFSSLLTILSVLLGSTLLAQAQFDLVPPIITSGETAVLSGLNENPPVVSPGVGLVKISLGVDSAQYELTYANMGAAAQAHIHLGNPGTNGGVIAFLCTNLGNAPTAATPVCPAPGVPVIGTLTSAEVLAAMDGTRVLLSAGDFEGFKQAIVGGATYVNLHTADHLGGEIRGQINPRTR